MKTNKLANNYLKNNAAGYLSKDQRFTDLKKYLRLDLGENLLINNQIFRKIPTIGKENILFYSDPSNEVIKQTIAESYNLSSKNIIIANSTNELIDLIPRILIDPNKKTLVVTPTFFRFIDTTIKAGGKILRIKLDKKNNFYPTKNVIDKICKFSIKHKPYITWLCNPNNPTGEVYQLKDIEQIIKISSGLVVIDEAFYEFYDYKNENSAIKLVNKYPNVLVLRTLSKAYGLAGLRFGYGLGHPKIISLIENYHNTLLMTSAFVVKLAEIAILNRQVILKSIEETQREKIWLYQKISQLSNLEIGADTKANIYLLRHKQKDLYQELLIRNILTADFRDVEGLEGLRYVRVTIGKRKQNKLLLYTLKEIN